MKKTNKQKPLWEKPIIIDLGDVLDVVKGLGGGKEAGVTDNQFAPLQVSSGS